MCEEQNFFTLFLIFVHSLLADNLILYYIFTCLIILFSLFQVSWKLGEISFTVVSYMLTLNVLYKFYWYNNVVKIIRDSMVVKVGLGVPCSPRDPRFAGSNPAEVDGFFSGSKNPEHKSSGRDFKLGVPDLRFQAR